MPYPTASNILARIYGRGRGKVYTPKDFLDLASGDSARQVLSRLASKGEIRRLMHGVYEYPVYSTLLNAPASPNPDCIAHAIARAHGWTILPSGDTALNLLGLSTQVPAQWQYFSDGPSREYSWAGGTISFKRRTTKETSALSTRTALMVQALKALGKSEINENVLAKLRAEFSPEERKRALKDGRYATSWVYEIIKRLAADGESTDA